MKSRKSATREWVETLVIAVLLALVLRTFFVQSFKIPSGSMIPTLKVGDKLLVTKITYGAKVPFTDFRLPGFKSPQRGDIIVFKYPLDEKRDFIKRLIGKEGDKVKINDGKIFIHGSQAELPQINKNHYYAAGPFGQDEILVPADSYYALGDNSYASKDSRYWGFVPEENIVGKAFFIFWPPHRIQILK